MGNLHAQHGEYDDAIACFTWVLKLNDTNAEAYNNLGSVYEGMGKYDDAIQMYKKSVALKSAQEEAHYNLARLEYALSNEQPDDAKRKEITDRLQFVLSIHPKSTKVRQLLEKIEGSGRADT